MQRVILTIVLWLFTATTLAADPRLKFEDITPVWSNNAPYEVGFLPHNPRVIYMTSEGEYQPFFYNLDTRVLTKDDILDKDGTGVFHPTWSSDGSVVAYCLRGHKNSFYVYHYATKITTTIQTGLDQYVGFVWVSNQQIVVTTGKRVFFVDVADGKLHEVRGVKDSIDAVAYIAATRRLYYSRWGEINSGLPTAWIYEAEFDPRVREIRNSRLIVNHGFLGGEVLFSPSRDGRFLVGTAAVPFRKGVFSTGVFVIDVARRQFWQYQPDEGWNDDQAFISPDATGMLAISVSLDGSGRQQKRIRYSINPHVTIGD